MTSHSLTFRGDGKCPHADQTSLPNSGLYGTCSVSEKKQLDTTVFSQQGHQYFVGGHIQDNRLMASWRMLLKTVSLFLPAQLLKDGEVKLSPSCRRAQSSTSASLKHPFISCICYQSWCSLWTTTVTFHGQGRSTHWKSSEAMTKPSLDNIILMSTQDHLAMGEAYFRKVRYIKALRFRS